MKLITKRNSMSMFYYIIAIDGKIEPDELEEFYSMGRKLDEEKFDSYKDELIKLCELNLDKARRSDDFYKYVRDCMGRLLFFNPKEGITGRHLIWNMMTIANSDGEYATIEKKLIHSIADEFGIPKNVISEMEQLISSALELDKLYQVIIKSDKSFIEKKALIDIIQKRNEAIFEAASNLIEDILDNEEEEEEKPEESEFEKMAVEGAAAVIEGTEKLLEFIGFGRKS